MAYAKAVPPSTFMSAIHVKKSSRALSLNERIMLMFVGLFLEPLNPHKPCMAIRIRPMNLDGEKARNAADFMIWKRLR